jgi:GWxTD domain-containing protein
MPFVRNIGKEYNYANKNFSYGLMKEGWTTERGRVYLMYGPPTEIDRHPLLITPKELMKYGFMLRLLVAFVSISWMYRISEITSSYILHAPGEIRNENWYHGICGHGCSRSIQRKIIR